RGFRRVGLGPRVLRADTAPLALLAWLGIEATTRRDAAATAGAPGSSGVDRA
ncbi:MAG: 16S rRNA (uracil(1498)-N(3))-methyltransferase, partial [Caldimonas sp.]